MAEWILTSSDLSSWPRYNTCTSLTVTHSILTPPDSSSQPRTGSLFEQKYNTCTSLTVTHSILTQSLFEYKHNTCTCTSLTVTHSILTPPDSSSQPRTGSLFDQKHNTCTSFTVAHSILTPPDSSSQPCLNRSIIHVLP